MSSALFSDDDASDEEESQVLSRPLHVAETQPPATQKEVQSALAALGVTQPADDADDADEEAGTSENARLLASKQRLTAAVDDANEADESDADEGDEKADEEASYERDDDSSDDEDMELPQKRKRENNEAQEFPAPPPKVPRTGQVAAKVPAKVPRQVLRVDNNGMGTVVSGKGGKGLGKGQMAKRHMSRRVYDLETCAQQAFNKPTCRKLCMLAGLKRINGDLYLKMREHANIYCQELMNKALVYVMYGRGKTLKAEHILRAYTRIETIHASMYGIEGVNQYIHGK